MLLKRICRLLQTTPYIITTCLWLHNLCFIYGNVFDINGPNNVEEYMKITSLEIFGDLRIVDSF